jgi:hypothetical protein
VNAKHRAAAIEATRAAVEAEAQAAKSAGPGGPVAHRAAMFQSALGLMEKAHELSGQASAPGGPEATGESKSTQLSEADLEEIFYDAYAKATGIRERGTP